MARKYDEIKWLAQATAQDLSADKEEWKGFLTTAGRLYRYPFMDQLLIYAQRPDATACAELETWNQKMNCWVNKGSKGITLLDESSGRPRLRYVFDVSNVHPGSVSAGTYYVHISNALSMEEFDDLDIQNYSLTITPVLSANKITITSMSGTEGNKYVTYSGYGNHFRTSTGTVTVTGYATLQDSSTNTTYYIANTPVIIMYYNPYWEENNTSSYAYVYAYGVTDSNGRYSINISLPPSAGSLTADSGVSYHYFDFCAMYAILTDSPSVRTYEPFYHYSYSIYHSF